MSSWERSETPASSRFVHENSMLNSPKARVSGLSVYAKGLKAGHGYQSSVVGENHQ
jgi:hypothetical protein